MKSLPEDRDFIRKKSLCACVVWISTVTIWYFIFPVSVPHLETSWDKVVYTLRWLHLSVYTLLFGIISVGTTRYQTNAIDPLTGRGEHLVDVSQRYLRNTMEQLVLHVTGLLTLSSYLPPHLMTLIPCFVMLFVIGRATFLIGYRISSLHRTFGFSLTFIGNIVTLLSCTVFICVTGPSNS